MSYLKREKFMMCAIRKARQGIRRGQTPFGACIVKGGKIISSAHNGVWQGADSTAHAEMRAIKKACSKLKTIDLSGCLIYSTCEPCPMCFSACHWSKISCIIYGSKIYAAKKLGFNELCVSNEKMKKIGKSKIRVMGGVLRDENIALFKMWLKQPGKRTY